MGLGHGGALMGFFVATLEMERAGIETGWSGAGKFGNTVWTGGSDFWNRCFGQKFLNRSCENL